MRLKRACLLAALTAALLAGLAVASPADDPAVPYGKYSGSATGGSGNKTIDAIVYLEPSVGDGVKVTFVTSKLPFPVSVVGTAQRTGTGYNIPVEVSMPAVRLNGSGVLRVRPAGESWMMYGTGSGTFRKWSGSGRGSGKLVSQEAGLGEQVSQALRGFLSFGGDDAKPPSVEEFDEAQLDAEPAAADGSATAEEPSDASPEGAGPTAAAVAPPDAAEQLSIIGLFLFLLSLGVFL